MAWYRTGTVSITINTGTVTGVGTNFSANARVGDGFRGPDGQWYEVTNIASATVLSITPNYAGATVSANANWSIAPIQGYVKDSADKLRALADASSTKQEGSQNLTGLSAVPSAADRIPYFVNGTGGMTWAAFPAQARTFMAATTPALQRSALALGTSATVDSTASTTDGTVGRSLRVGDFGVGSFCVNLTSLDLNAERPSGFYYCISCTNGPNVSNGFLIHQDYIQDGYATQTYSQVVGAATSSPTWNRTQVNGVWTAWGRSLTNLDLTTTTTDGAAGKVLKVGDWGLGSTGAAVPGDNLNNLNMSGFYVVTSVSANSPVAGRSYQMIHIERNTVYATQIAYDILSNDFWVRRRTTATPTWSTWIRSLNVGDFGLGSAAVTLSATDLNADIETGFYYSSSGSNRPGVINGWLCVQKLNTSYTSQTYFDLTGKMSRRFLYNGTWQLWRTVYDQESILGTVSQTGGIPTGAIIERGSNTNGEYVKFADGTMICTVNSAVSGTIAANVTSGIVAQVWPATFIAPPKVSGNAHPQTSNDHYGVASIQGITTSGCNLIIRNGATAQTFTCSSIAIGRWF